MKSSLLAALLLIGPSAQATGLDYNYLEASYFQGEVDDALDFDGVNLRGTAAIGNWLLTGGHERSDTDPVDLSGLFRVEAGIREWHAGGGYAFALHDNLDFVPEVGFVRVEARTEVVDLSNGNDVSIIPDQSDTGYYAAAGLRGAAGPFEAEFVHRFSNVLGDRQNDWRFELRYLATPSFAVGLGYRNREGETMTAAAFRWFY